MNILKDFCKDRSIRLIDISHLEFDGICKMMKNILKKDNVMLVLDHNRTKKQVNNIFEMNEKVCMKNKIRIAFKEDFMYFDVNVITSKILTRWFNELQDNTNNETCPICLECCKNTNICCPICLNVFHKECMIKSMVNLQNTNCPVCKSKCLVDIVGIFDDTTFQQPLPVCRV